MNIFVLNENPILAARDHCDKHVIKQILESAQMLSTAHWLGWERFLQPNLRKDERLKDWLRSNVRTQLQPCYKMTHANHPCTQWAARSWDNYMWLSQHGLELCREYTERYGREHKSHDVHRWLTRVVPPTFEMAEQGLTPFAVAMPEKYKISADPVQCYRAYYLGEKSRFAKWSRSKAPSWWEPASYLSLGGEHDTEFIIETKDEGTVREGKG